MNWPVNVGGQQHELLKHEPPFEQPVVTGHSGSNATEIFFTRQVLDGPQPGKQVLLPSALQVKWPSKHELTLMHFTVQLGP